MRSEDTCMLVSSCGGMCVRGVWKTNECKVFSRLTVGYGRKCRDVCIDEYSRNRP